MRPADLQAVLARPIAHRGLHDRALGRVENSLEAAEAAVAAGFGIECDVQLSADGEAMVFHDETLERLTAANGRVDARASADLAALVLEGGGTLPTLARFLATVAGRVPLVIEIKSRGDGAGALAARATALVAGYAGPVALKSFDAGALARCRTLGATCPLGLVGPGRPTPQPSPSPPFDFLSWNVAHLPDLRSSSAATPLMAWTVRSDDAARQAAYYGAQIVFEHFRPAAPT